MKRKDILFQKSVAGKSRHIPAGYNERILNTLNNLPDTVPCVSEETAVHVITQKRNYRYIVTAVSAAALIIITGGAYLRYGMASGEDKNKNDPKTTVKVTTVTSVVYNGKVTEPAVTYETSLPQTDSKVSDPKKNDSTQNNDIAGDPDQINKNNNTAAVTQKNGQNTAGDAEVTENKKSDKVQNTKQPAKKEPSSTDKYVPATDAPVQTVPEVTAPVPVPPDEEKDKGKKEDNDEKKDKPNNRKDEIWGDNPFERPDAAGKGPFQEQEPEHFMGDSGVGSKPAQLHEDPKKEVQRIQSEWEKEQEHQMPYLPFVPECENEFPYPQD